MLRQSKLKWIIGIPVVTVFLVYGVLAGFLWWSEHSLAGDISEQPSVYVPSKEPHQITLLDTGVDSLAARLHLIDHAKRSIELEFFIYELDLASRLITQHLIEAAKRGVKVRLLVDFAGPVFRFQPQYAKRLAQFGIETRYYNTVDTIRIISVQHRSHRKLLIVDDQYVISGGRNIGNDYFNLSTHYSFLDSDILIEGPIAPAVRASFDTYWSSKLSTKSKQIEADGDLTTLESFFTKSSEMVEIETKLGTLTSTQTRAAHKHTCNNLTFVTDFPGVLMNNRQVYYRLKNILEQAKQTVVAESPYLILRRDGIKIFESLRDRGVKTTLLTNGLNATDAYYTVSATANVTTELEKSQAQIFLYNGSTPKELVHLVSPTPQRWGLHAKRAVIDGKHTLIGTYNIDPRSANLNSELMFVCRDSSTLAQAVLDNMQLRRKNAHLLIDSSSSPLSALIRNAPTTEIIKFTLARPLAALFAFLL